MQHTDITKSEWNALVESIKQPDGVFKLSDLTRAVMGKFNVDEKTAKRVVRRYDQQMTASPRTIANLFRAIGDIAEI